MSVDDSRSLSVDFDYDDTSSSPMSNRSGDHHDTVVLAQNESKAVSRLRIAVVSVLIASTVAVSVIAFTYLKRNEAKNFEDSYYDQANVVLEAVRIKSNRRIGTVRSFAEALTSHAVSNGQTWPNVTLPDFERQGTATTRLADIMSLILVPIVSDWQRDGWEEYSIQNQAWLPEGLEVQREEAEKRGDLEIGFGSGGGGSPDPDDLSIPEKIHRVDGLAPAQEDGPGPYLPQWQIAPALSLPELVSRR
jgi:hypothetical protein